MKFKTETLSFIMLAAFGAATMQSCSPDRAKAYNARTNVNANGLAFIKEAHEGGLTEIEASKLAQKISTNKEVTDFAAMMVKEHGEADAEINKLADEKYVILHEKLGKDKQIILDSLATKTGEHFDEAYMELMVEGHEKAEELYKENETSTYTAIREVVEKILPKVKHHLEEAKAIKAKLK